MMDKNKCERFGGKWLNNHCMAKVEVMSYGESEEEDVMYDEVFDEVGLAEKEILELVEECLYESCNFDIKVEGKPAKIDLSVDLKLKNSMS